MVKTNELNAVYQRLDIRMRAILQQLMPFKEEYGITHGYFNGHYVKTGDGHFVMNYYPIPVISLPGLCDLEIDLENLSVSTKLSKEAAMRFDYTKIAEFPYEVFGVEDYLTDYYQEGESLSTLLHSLEVSEEKEIAFAFSFDFDFEGLFEFLSFLKQNQFYY